MLETMTTGARRLAGVMTLVVLLAPEPAHAAAGGDEGCAGWLAGPSLASAFGGPADLAFLGLAVVGLSRVGRRRRGAPVLRRAPGAEPDEDARAAPTRAA